MRTILITALLCTASLLLPCAHAQQSEADRQAMAQLRAEAEKGEAEAQFLLGEAYYVGKFGLATNHVEAVKWFRKAAEQKDAQAQCNLGVAYGNGYGVTKDYAEAVKWWRKAAEQNDAAAQFSLGACYDNGPGVAAELLPI